MFRHVIESNVCKHASNACDSSDGKLRFDAWTNEETGVCEGAGFECGAVENSPPSFTRCVSEEPRLRHGNRMKDKFLPHTSCEPQKKHNIQRRFGLFR